jgi:glycosyltransferase involved in cell wall biosynthesis
MHYHAETLRSVARVLASRGISFAVLSAQDEEGAVGRVAMRDKVVPLHWHFKLSEWRFGRFQLRFQHGLLAMVRTLRPKVLISTCHSGTASEWQVLRWARRNGVRTVAWQCGYEYNPGRVKSRVLSHFVPLFSFHLCYHSNAEVYAQRYGAEANQTLVMHNTLDECSIVPMSQLEAKREVFELHPELSGKKIVLYVGAVLEEKRLEVIFDAIERLQRDDTIFVVVGDGPHLQALKARYGQRKDWLPVGRVVEGVGRYFDAADVFVLPGTGGLAINEAMAHRLPVISGYADGSADDLVLDSVTGYRLKNADASEFAAALNAVLLDTDRARAMGLAGEQRIRGVLSFKSFVERVVGVVAAQCALAETKS